MIHVVAGLPGNGKSLWVAGLSIKRLLTNWQFVAGNFAWKEAELQDYLHRKGSTVHVEERVKVLTDDQTRNFWLHREYGLELPTPDGYEDKNSQSSVDYSPLFIDPRYRIGGALDTLNEHGKKEPAAMRGTLYLIDEAHNIWPARGWQGTPRHLLFYLSQHRKLNDDIIIITQAVKNLDGVVSRLAQDFTYCQNHRLRKYGSFKGGNGFTARTYSAALTNPREQTPMVQVDYPLDLAIARCYDSSAGVGMPGGTPADKGKKVKGLPMWTIWVGLAVIILVFFGLFRWAIPKLTNHFLGTALDPKHHAATLGQATGLMPSSSPRYDGVTATPTAPKGKEDDIVWVDGYVEYIDALDRHRINVLLSNGLTVTEENLKRLARNYIETKGGVIYPRRQCPPGTTYAQRRQEALSATAKTAPGGTGPVKTTVVNAPNNDNETTARESPERGIARGGGIPQLQAGPNVLQRQEDRP